MFQGLECRTLIFATVLQLGLQDTLHTTLDAIDATRRRAMRRGPRLSARLSADSGAFTMRTKLKILAEKWHLRLVIFVES